MAMVQCPTCLVCRPASEMKGGQCTQCASEKGTKMDVKSAVNNNRYDNTVDKINALPKGGTTNVINGKMTGVMGDKWV